MHPSHLDLDPLIECSASPLGSKVFGVYPCLGNRVWSNVPLGVSVMILVLSSSPVGISPSL